MVATGSPGPRPPAGRGPRASPRTRLSIVHNFEMPRCPVPRPDASSRRDDSSPDGRCYVCSGLSSVSPTRAGGLPQGSDKTEARQQSPNLSNSDQYSDLHRTILQS